MDKTNDAPCLVARFPMNREGERGLALLRRYANRDGYRMRVLFSGKKHGGFHVRKADAHTARVYLDRIPNASERQQAERQHREFGELLELRRRVSETASLMDRLREAHAEELEKVAVDYGTVLRECTDLTLELNEANAQRNEAQRTLNMVPRWLLWLLSWWNAKVHFRRASAYGRD